MPIYTLDGQGPDLPTNGRYWIAPDATIIGRVRLLEDASVWYNGFVIVHASGMVEWQLAPAATPGAPNFTATDINIKPLVISWVVLPFSPP